MRTGYGSRGFGITAPHLPNRPGPIVQCGFGITVPHLPNRPRPIVLFYLMGKGDTTQQDVQWYCSENGLYFGNKDP